MKAMFSVFSALLMNIKKLIVLSWLHFVMSATRGGRFPQNKHWLWEFVKMLLLLQLLGFAWLIYIGGNTNEVSAIIGPL